MWVGKLTGYSINEKFAAIHFSTFLIAINIVFFPMHFLGFRLKTNLVRCWN